MKIDPHSLPKGRRDELTEDILTMFGKLGLSDEGKLLLKALLTESEMIMLARRRDIASRLLCGHSFQKITEELQVGLTTVRSVHQWLEQKLDDYRSVLPLLVENNEKDPFFPPLSHITIQKLRHRYPTNFHLFSVLLTEDT